MIRKRPATVVVETTDVINDIPEDVNVVQPTKSGTAISDDPDRIRWRKKGGGIHRHWDGQVVRRGEILTATAMEIEPFKHLFDAIDPLPEEKKPSVGLRIEHRGGGKYNVINEVTGLPVNDRLLTKEEVEELVNG